MTAPRPGLELVPLTYQQACAFIESHHRHHRRPPGHKWSVGVCVADVLELTSAGDNKGASDDTH
jgi:hypothetical protein